MRARSFLMDYFFKMYYCSRVLLIRDVQHRRFKQERAGNTAESPNVETARKYRCRKNLRKQSGFH